MTNERIEENDDKSHDINVTLLLPDFRIISWHASSERFGSRHAKYTFAPLLTKSIAVSFPTPVFAPVIITTFPVKRIFLFLNCVPCAHHLNRMKRAKFLKYFRNVNYGV